MQNNLNDSKGWPMPSQPSIKLRKEDPHLDDGVVTTCQFGNSFDTRGFMTDHKVVILATHWNAMLGITSYLVQSITQPNLYGRAHSSRDEDIEDELYCTNARRVAEVIPCSGGELWTHESAKKSLGFN